MSLDRAYVDKVIREGCDRLGMWSQAAHELLLGTCAAESLFGKYRRQIGRKPGTYGPARGIFQMEPATYYWLIDVYGDKFPWIRQHCDAMINDDVLAAAMCRLRYRIVKDPLPPAGNLLTQAEYWKKWYNTYKGAGTVQGYIRKYREYVE